VTGDFFPTKGKEEDELKRNLVEAVGKLKPFANVELTEAASAIWMAIVVALPLADGRMPAPEPAVMAARAAVDAAGAKGMLGQHAWRDLTAVVPWLNILSDYAAVQLNRKRTHNDERY